MKHLISVLLVVLVVASALTATARAQVPTLLPVPNNLPAAVKAELQGQRDSLSSRWGSFRDQAKAYNKQYGNRDFPEDDPMTKTGLAEKARLDQTRQALLRDSITYNSLVQTHTRVGAITESRGEFYLVTADGRKWTGEEAATAPVGPGTRIVTGPDGHVRLMLLDETVFTVSQNGDMVIDEFVYDPDASVEKVSARVTKGLFRWVTGKIARKSPTEMKVVLPAGYSGILASSWPIISGFSLGSSFGMPIF